MRHDFCPNKAWLAVLTSRVGARGLQTLLIPRGAIEQRQSSDDGVLEHGSEQVGELFWPNRCKYLAQFVPGVPNRRSFFGSFGFTNFSQIERRPHAFGAS